MPVSSLGLVVVSPADFESLLHRYCAKGEKQTKAHEPDANSRPKPELRGDIS
jgi:hypothetical protein